MHTDVLKHKAEVSSQEVSNLQRTVEERDREIERLKQHISEKDAQLQELLQKSREDPRIQVEIGSIVSDLVDSNIRLAEVEDEKELSATRVRLSQEEASSYQEFAATLRPMSDPSQVSLYPHFCPFPPPLYYTSPHYLM